MSPTCGCCRSRPWPSAFEITGLAGDLAEVGESSISGPEEFEPMVVVAMLFWAVAAWFALFVLRLIFRPAG